MAPDHLWLPRRTRPKVASPPSIKTLEEDLRKNLEEEEERLSRVRGQASKNQELLLHFENGVDNLILRLCDISVPGQVRPPLKRFLWPAAPWPSSRADTREAPCPSPSSLLSPLPPCGGNGGGEEQGGEPRCGEGLPWISVPCFAGGLPQDGGCFREAAVL